MAAARERWNLNIHYHRVVLDAASPNVATALDVGCGEGLLAFDVADRGASVIGIDPDGSSINRAEADPRASSLTQFICGDLFTYPFERQSFDLVASNAMLHHVDAQAGLRRMRELVRPGGVLVVVGFAQRSGLRDRSLEVAGAVTKRAHQLRGNYWEHNAPVQWPPPLTTKQMATLGSAELPGSTFRRRMSNRYAVVWNAPIEERQQFS